MLVQDVALFVNAQVFRYNLQAFPSAEWPPDKQTKIADDLWIGKIDKGLADKVFEACAPPGYWETKPQWQIGQLYAFVRELEVDSKGSDIYSWDKDQRLQRCITLSRLLHPLTSYHYSARILYKPDGQTIKDIAPVLTQPDTAYAINSPRGWLIASELESLKDLFRSLYSSKFSEIERLWRALCYYELAARSRFIDIKWIFLYTALEALVYYGHFVEWVPKLARELGLNFSQEDAGLALKLRSEISHGEGLPDPKSWASIPDSDKAYMLKPLIDSETLQLYNRMENVLRRVLIRAIHNTEFAENFTKPKKVKEYFKTLV